MTEVTGEVIGFRQWRVSDDLVLLPTAAPGTWTSGENEASCLAQNLMGTHDCQVCPGHHCHCGLYALHEPRFWYGSDAGFGGLVQTVTSWGGVTSAHYVAGLIAAWGRIEVHRDGFRAERARVVAIAIPESKLVAAVARAVAREYKLPMVPQKELQRVAGEFGQVVPRGLRPARQPEEEIVTYASGASVSWQHSVAGTSIQFGQQPGAWVHMAPPTTIMPTQPSAPRPAPSAHIARRIAALNAPTYSPGAFLPKRKGGQA